MDQLTGLSHDIRKSIARVLTIINAKQRNQLRLFYKNKKFAPLDLRPKQTRAIRRRLSPEDQARTLAKTKKRSTHFPQRKFAIKVRFPADPVSVWALRTQHLSCLHPLPSLVRSLTHHRLKRCNVLINA